MSYVILNGDVIEEDEVKIHISNRVFRYGDGLFETIVCCKRDIKYFRYHWERLVRGMEKFHYKYNNAFDYESVKLKIFQLLELNNQQTDTRVRLQVFRNIGGLYTPTDNTISYLLESNMVTAFLGINLAVDSYLSVSFCESISLNFSTISDLKTCNSIPYIIASIEKQQKGLDDLILTDDDNNIAECCSSNIFWWDRNRIFTPDLQSGCIAGVMRRVLLENFKKWNIEVEVGLFPRVMLKSAQTIFTSNCMGIKFIGTIYDKTETWHSADTELFTKSQAFASIQSLF